jgi:hypothetical protein
MLQSVAEDDELTHEVRTWLFVFKSLTMALSLTYFFLHGRTTLIFVSSQLVLNLACVSLLGLNGTFAEAKIRTWDKSEQRPNLELIETKRITVHLSLAGNYF